ncbi:MAG: hypothetical protein ACRD3A_09660 [Terriglobales bacterium]
MVTRTLKVGALLFGLVFLSVGVAAQVPVSVLMDNVRQPASYVGGYLYLEKPGAEEMSRSDAEAIYPRATQCTGAVEKALAAGVSPTRTVNVHVVETAEGAMEGEDRPMSLSEVKEMCGRMGAVAGRAHYLDEASQRAMSASNWPQKLLAGEVSGWYTRAALEAGTNCVEAIDRALKNGASDTTLIQMVGSDTKPLGEAREMCVYVRDEAQKIADKEKAAEDAGYKPYRDVLSGDKLALYNSRMKRLKVYGHGGRLLNTPQDYKLSNVWCEVGVNREGAMPMWELACWRFVGMKQVSGPTTKQGVGDEPPSSAFP